MASSRVGKRMSARMGPRLPLVLGTEVASIRWIIGMRKLSVLPVPVEAVARISLPSRAGGMALAWTGVGVVKPALVRRLLSESEMLKSVKRMSPTRERVAGFVVAVLWWGGLEVACWWFCVCCSFCSKVAEFKICPVEIGYQSA